MIARGFAMFDTAIGACGIAWSDVGITGFQLPESDAVSTRGRMRTRFDGVDEAIPPPFVQETIAAVVALMRGERVDLAFIPLDMDGVPEFHQRVYEAARTILAGATTTYGELAERIGEPRAAQAVGQALGCNPFPVIVPCHRVTGAGGKMGGFSAPGGRTTKLKLLAIEGAHLF